MTLQACKRYKHRVVVEITTNKPILDKEAVQAMKILFGDINMAKPIWCNAHNIRPTRLDAKSFGRVVEGLNRPTRRVCP